MDAHGKARIILAKPPGERGTDRKTSESNKQNVPKTLSISSDSRGSDSTTPTKILKSKDNGRSAASPVPLRTTATTPTFGLSPLNTSSLSRDLNIEENNTAASNSTKIQIQQKSTAAATVTQGVTNVSQHERISNENVNPLESRLAAYPEMKGCVKLVDESLQWCDQTFEFLQDQSDFLVVGVLGLQGTGKSTVMSHLYGGRSTRNPKYGVFKTQTKDQRELGEHGTRGIDIIITDQRMILLDVQPVLSASIMDHMIQFEKKFPAEYNSTENALEIQSLQVAAFLFTVCHTIIVVQDWFTDPNLLRFLQTAEMLRPSALLPKQDGSLDDASEYCPHLVLVHNKCSLTDFEPAKVKLVQETYSTVFHRSKLKFKGEVGIATGTVIPCLSPKICGESMNLFLIPYREDDTPKSQVLEGIPEYRGHQGFQQLMDTLRDQITSMPRNAMCQTALTEKNWFHYAARTWETVKKSGLFMEYCRLLP
ncbi:smg-9, nonsense mediated mRNA decay factor [Chamberlinius hualienensis]